jgi:hypothetical protein
MSLEYGLGELIQVSRTTLRDVPLVEIRLNRDLLAVYCAEAVLRLFAEGAIDFNEVVGAEHAICLIEDSIRERENVPGQKIFVGDVREYVYSMAQYVLDNLPTEVSKLIDSLMLKWELANGIQHSPDNRQLAKVARSIIFSHAEESATESVRTLGLKVDARGGSEAMHDLSQLAKHFERIYPDIEDAKKIYKSNHRDKRWKMYVGGAYPQLPADLIERLNPITMLSDELRAKLSEKGGTSAASDLTLEYAAHLCGAPPYRYTIRHLKGILSQQGMSVKKVKAKRKD